MLIIFPPPTPPKSICLWKRGGHVSVGFVSVILKQPYFKATVFQKGTNDFQTGYQWGPMRMIS